MAQPPLEIPILFEDDFLLVVSKPSGLPTESTIDPKRLNLHRWLQEQRGLTLFLHHRLDKDTSGVILFSKSKAANGPLTDMFRGHHFRKVYWAIARGETKTEFTIKNHLQLIRNPKPSRVKSVLSRGDPAETHFKTLQKLQNCTWLECLPITGRTHQIRVHLSELGHPILGDSLYGGNDSRVPRLMLHAQGLEFPHPMNNKPLFIQAKVPSDFGKILKNVSI